MKRMEIKSNEMNANQINEKNETNNKERKLIKMKKKIKNKKYLGETVDNNPCFVDRIDNVVISSEQHNRSLVVEI